MERKNVYDAITSVMKPTGDEQEYFEMCLEKGIVKRTILDLNLCSNPDCDSCRETEQFFKKTMSLIWKKYDNFE